MKFSDFPLARKLAAGFGAVLLIVAASSLFTVVEVRQVADTKRLNSSSSAASAFLDQIRGDVVEARADVHKLILTGADADKVKAEANLGEMTRDMDAIKAILAKDGAQFLPDLADYQAKIDGYLHNRLNPEIALASDPASRPQAAAMVTSGDSAPYSAAMESSFRGLRDKINAWSDAATTAGDRAMDRIFTVVIAGGLLSTLLGLAMAWLITRAIGRPLTAMTDTMRRLAAGDNGVAIPALGQTDEVGLMARAVQVFKEAAIERGSLERAAVEARVAADADRARHEAGRTEAARRQAQVVHGLAAGLERLSEGDLVFRLDDPFAADYEKLRDDFNGAVQKLQDTMRVVATNASAIRSGTGEITSASDDLSRRTEQQAASLEETAAALDEITATVKKTSEGSLHARTVVSGAKADAEHSGQVVRQAVAAMGAIETSSRQIGQIIGVIDEIAFQTNLLALNAGVEAARAGDAGRGFAVVASEVRGLAQRSAEAAKEIKALISASSQQVSDGVELVGETGRALERIVVQVADISGIVTEIAASAQEQAVALQQVNTAINQMDQVTQQNAAMVEESTAASHTLARDTEELATLIGRFAVGRGAVSAPAPRRAGASSPPGARRPGPASPVAALKTTGPGSAARRVEPAADDNPWTEF